MTPRQWQWILIGVALGIGIVLAASDSRSQERSTDRTPTPLSKRSLVPYSEPYGPIAPPVRPDPPPGLQGFQGARICIQSNDPRPVLRCEYGR